MRNSATNELSTGVLQMENIEDKLETYRLRRRRQEKIKQVKDKFKRFCMYYGKKELHDVRESNEYLAKTLSILSEACEDDISDLGETGNLHFQYILRFVYLAFWFTLYIIAIEIQFGVVFLMLSAIAGIYFNTRTGPKKRSEISAYSVFNKNCESIDGTLKAEMFEQQIGIR